MGSISPRNVLTGMNVAVAAAGGIFGALGILKPKIVTGIDEPMTRGMRFFTQMYGVRALAIAVLVISSLLQARPGTANRLVPLLSLAAIVQAGDIVIALHNRTPGFVGATLAALVHGGSVVVLRRADDITKGGGRA